MFTVKDILTATKGRLLAGTEDYIFSGISTDTRRLRADKELFLAIKGGRFDGHNFILDAISRGAGGIVIQEGCIANSNFKIPDMPFISVTNTIEALGDIANYHRSRFKIPLLAITGSNGKTTTKEMIASILSKRFDILKNSGTENNNIGLSLTLVRLNPRHKAAVVEMGTNHLGEIRRLSEIAMPTKAVITNIGPSHIEYLKNINTVLKAKCEIFEYMDRDAEIIINGDDKMLRDIKSGFKKVTFGMDRGNDFYAENVRVDPEGITFRLNGKWEINLAIVGRHNVYNTLAAISAVWDFGLSIDEIKDALRAFEVPDMRMQVKKIGNIKVINDSYNSNPLSMKKAIETLKDITTEERKILIVGDMLELGNLSIRFHHLLGRQAAESGIDLIVAVGRLSGHIANGAYEAGMSEKKVKLYSATKEASESVADLIKEGDIVLIKGSRAMRMEQVVEALEEKFR